MSSNDPPATPPTRRVHGDTDMAVVDATNMLDALDSVSRLQGLLHPVNSMSVSKAVEINERAVHEGVHVCTMCNIGALLEEGPGGEQKDPVLVKSLYERAIQESGHVGALCGLGTLLEKGAEGVPKDAVRAKQLYERAIQEGAHVNAMCTLGTLLENGAESVPKDAVRAKELYERVIQERDHFRAMCRLGALLEEGAEGVPKDAVRAMELYELVIQAGHIGAICRLRPLHVQGTEDVSKDEVHAEKTSARVRTNDYVDAICRYGALLQEGTEDVQKDAVRAKELYERATRGGGHVGAMCGLGALLEEGAEGVPKDTVRAKQLYERAIEEGGHVDAMCRLGALLEKGAEGVPEDAVCAKELYERAIQQGGHIGAMCRLGALLQEGAEGVPQDTVQAKELYERIIHEGCYAEAMLRLGALLAHGAEGVPKDPKRGRGLYELVVTDLSATCRLGTPLKQGAESVPQDTVRATRLHERFNKKGVNVNDIFIRDVIIKQLRNRKRRLSRAHFEGRSLIEMEEEVEAFKKSIEATNEEVEKLLERVPFKWQMKARFLPGKSAPTCPPHFCIPPAVTQPTQDTPPILSSEVEPSGECTNQSTSPIQAHGAVLYFDDWKRDLITAATGFEIQLGGSDAGHDTEGDLPPQTLIRNSHRSHTPPVSSPWYGSGENLLPVLGMSEAEDFKVIAMDEIRKLFSQLVRRTTWEAFEKLDDSAAIAYADFHQVLDGVLTGKVTNCLLNCEENTSLPAHAIYANVQGSPICLGIRFMGSDAYIDYKGYVRRITSFEAKTESDMARLHVDGPWLAGRGVVRGTAHNIGPVQVAGPRSLTKLARELSGGNPPSDRTIKLWRKEFAVLLSTSDLWFSWRKVHSTCEVLRCKEGQMVITTSELTFARNLGVSISREGGLDIAQEEFLADSTNEEVGFDDVVVLMGAKIASNVLGNTADEEIARALYISSSWFSIKGPRAKPGNDCAWGNASTNPIPSAEIVEWIPTTREIRMAGWKLIPHAITPTGRDWGPLQTGYPNESAEDVFGRELCHLAPNSCVGPVHSPLECCLWGMSEG